MCKQINDAQHHTKSILVLVMGNTFDEIRNQLGDFGDWIISGLYPYQAVLLDARVSDLPDPRDFIGIVISGSHHMVTDELEWSQSVSEWLKQCNTFKVPILGICYGHQLLAYTFGGQVAENPNGLEVGTHTIRLTKYAEFDALFQYLPAQFDGQLVHYQSIIKLPQHAVVLAKNLHEPHHAFRIGDRIWGVQFHPEFSVDAMQAYLESLVSQNNTHAKNAQVSTTGDAAQLLRHFGRFCKALN